jgi:hypothetical protein
MNLKHIMLLSGLLLNSILYAQTKIVDRSNNVWLSNINKYELNKNWYLSSELHVRRTDGLEHWQQFLFRPAINYKIGDALELSAGYTFINSYPYGKQPIAIVTPENNVWQQVVLKQKIGNWSVSHRYRLEERFAGKTKLVNNEVKIYGTTFFQRFRYRFNVKRNLGEKFFVSAFDEVWINLENNFMPESLNQNWLFAGVGYKLNEKSNLQVGYMQQLIKKGDGVHYESNPTLQVTYAYTFGEKE